MFNTTQRGLAGAIAANIALGASSIYWKQLSFMSPYALLGYRIIFSLVTLAFIIFCAGKFSRLKERLTVRIAVVHASAAILIAINWTTFIWASINARVVESGIGYLFAPFVTLVVSAIFLRAPLRRGQILGLVIIGVAMLQLVIQGDGLQHWVYMTIGISWGLYTCLKKITPLDPFGGLFIETTFLSIILLPTLVAWVFIGNTQPTLGPLSPLLLACGIVSIVPLWLFSKSARQIPVAAVGLCQFFLPTTQFVVAVFYYRQTVNNSTLWCFIVIWATLALMMIGPILYAKNQNTHRENQ